MRGNKWVKLLAWIRSSHYYQEVSLRFIICLNFLMYSSHSFQNYHWGCMPAYLMPVNRLPADCLSNACLPPAWLPAACLPSAWFLPAFCLLACLSAWQEDYRQFSTYIWKKCKTEHLEFTQHQYIAKIHSSCTKTLVLWEENKELISAVRPPQHHRIRSRFSNILYFTCGKTF